MSSMAGLIDARSSTRTKILHRTRATLPDGKTVPMTMVDLSAGGFMARCDAAVTRGDRLWFDMPLIGRIDAEVRWALGGRFGCRLERVIPDDLLAAMLPALQGANDL